MSKHPVLKSYVIKSFYKILKEKYDGETAANMHIEHKELCVELADKYPNLSQKEKMHYYEQILPFIAAYKIMQKYDRENVDNILEEIIKRRSKQALSILNILLKLPGLYKKVSQIANLMITKSFSEDAGFRYDFVECQKTSWKANIVQCPYYEACKKFDCPKIAHYFCDSDDLIYGNMHKKVLWKRTKTLGRGQEVCDFYVEIKKD